ncbi:hypothetical protein [Nonomuraea turkmeniaca]|nr:hypothetical protein [Nonomuraea turkmeniaca]
MTQDLNALLWLESHFEDADPHKLSRITPPLLPPERAVRDFMALMSLCD